MDILVEIHIGSDWDEGVNAATISLDDAGIKNIFRLAKKVGKAGTYISEFDNTPELGHTELDFACFKPGNAYLKLDEIHRLNHTEDFPSLYEEEIFKSRQSDDNDHPVHTEIVELHVDHDDFWWEGVFKHTDIHWETRMIPLSFLPQELRQSGRKATTPARPLPDLNMTAEQMNAIHEKIAQGVSHGLNAREIDASFQRHITKAQLIRCIIELIERV